MHQNDQQIDVPVQQPEEQASRLAEAYRNKQAIEARQIQCLTRFTNIIVDKIRDLMVSDLAATFAECPEPMDKAGSEIPFQLWKENDN